MAIKRLKPKWNSTSPTSTAAPPASAAETGEFLVNRQTGSGYLKTNAGIMQDLGPVKSVNGQTGDVTISVPVSSVNGKTGALTLTSSDIQTDGSSISANYTLTTANKNGSILVVDNATDITVTVPPDNSVTIPLYSQILICQKAAGRAVVTPGAGVTVSSQGGVRNSGGAGTMCSLVKVAANAWILGGSLS